MSKVWQTIELSFEAQYKYLNPFRDVALQARISGPDGHQITIHGFWDGGNCWRIRFVCTALGNWSWITKCSHDDDLGLNGLSGTVTASGWTTEELNANPNRRGFLQIGASGRHFEYTDGTPFHWLGDTLWAGHTLRCETEHALPLYLEDRRQKGFTTRRWSSDRRRT